MKILLLTRNHVVREFIELVIERIGAKLFVAQNLKDAPSKAYDFVFIDDRYDFVEESQALLERYADATSVVLYSANQSKHEMFDIKVKKPFLPSDIQTILEQETADEEPSKLYLPEDQILNLQEIEEIKYLLEDEGMEIVSEEDLVNEIDGDVLLDLTDKGEKMKVQEDLFEALLKMEPKKIRKILIGAEIDITIRFPKD